MGQHPDRGKWLSSSTALGIPKNWLQRASQWLVEQGDTRDIRDLSQSDLCKVVDHVREKFASDPRNWSQLFNPNALTVPRDEPFEAGRQRYLAAMALRDEIQATRKRKRTSDCSLLEKSLDQVESAGAGLAVPIKIHKQRKDRQDNSPPESQAAPKFDARPTAEPTRFGKRSTRVSSLSASAAYNDPRKSFERVMQNARRIEARAEAKLQANEKIDIGLIDGGWTLYSLDMLELYQNLKRNQEIMWGLPGAIGFLSITPNEFTRKPQNYVGSVDTYFGEIHLFFGTPKAVLKRTPVRSPPDPEEEDYEIERYGHFVFLGNGHVYLDIDVHDKKVFMVGVRSTVGDEDRELYQYSSEDDAIWDEESGSDDEYDTDDNSDKFDDSSSWEDCDDSSDEQGPYPSMSAKRTYFFGDDMYEVYTPTVQ